MATAMMRPNSRFSKRETNIHEGLRKGKRYHDMDSQAVPLVVFRSDDEESR